MILYETAVKLKEAGFPQKCTLMFDEEKRAISCCVDDCYCPKCSDFEGDNIYYSIPTLSELIEACGLPFDLSCRNNAEKWYAFNIANNPLGKGGTTGDSPEEAVAKLYIATKHQD